MASHQDEASYRAGEPERRAAELSTLTGKGPETAEAAKEKTHEVKDRAPGKTREAKEKASGEAESAEEKTGGILHQTGEKASGAAESAKEKTGGLLHQTGEKVKIVAPVAIHAPAVAHGLKSTFGTAPEEEEHGGGNARLGRG